MSLSVDVFVLSEDGRMRVLDPAAQGADLAGFEEWRTTVWGSDAARGVGAKILPALATQYKVEVAPGQLDELLADCAVFRENLDLIAPPSSDLRRTHSWYVRQISDRLKNIESAAERARGLQGGVVIW